MRLLILLLAIASSGVVGSVHAQRSPSHPGCVADRYGNVACGPAGGHCLKDPYGDVKCSPADGGIMLDRYKTRYAVPAATGTSPDLVDTLA